jgi:type II secretory pathway pseudopilin PulG
VELLAVVLILAIISTIAVALYASSRKSAAARVCKANVTLLSKAQAAYMAHYGTYCFDSGAAAASRVAGRTFVPGTPPTGGLVGGPAGLATPLKCPLDGTIYRCTNGDDPGGVDVKCPNANTHRTDTGANGQGDWKRSLPPPAPDSL